MAPVAVERPPARLTVLSGPSGVGKGTVVAEVRRRHPDVWVSVSATTRAPRPGEENGVHYWFVSDEEFDALEASGRVVARYTGSNPNGSARDIAGVRNEAGNVVGIMPHPEHAVEELTGPGTDGLGFFTSVLKAVVNA